MKTPHPAVTFATHASFCLRQARISAWPEVAVALLCLLAVKLRLLRGRRWTMALRFRDYCLHINVASLELCSVWENYLDRQYGVTMPGATGMVVIDAGANVGVFAIQQLQTYPSDVMVIAVEPDPDVFERLKQNVAPYNDSHKQPVLLNAALGAKTGTVLFVRDRSTNSHVFSGEDVPSSAISVNVNMLDRIVEENQLQRIDLLKIDVEGWEMQVLEGGLEKALPITRNVVLEYHDRDGATLIDLLAEAGFRLAWRNERKSTLGFERTEARGDVAEMLNPGVQAEVMR